MSLDPRIGARHLLEKDPYNENKRMREALAYLGVNDIGALRDWYEHMLGCMKLEAAFLEQDGLYQPPDIEYEGEAYLTETEGYPTLLISPMTQALPDAMEVMSSLSKIRPMIVYGESMSVSAHPQLEYLSAGDGLSAVRKIRKVLRNNGILCTYLDFVYQGHPGVPVQLFNRPRVLSRGFISLAARRGAMLLPVLMVAERGVRKLRVLFEEPTLIPPLPESMLSQERPHLAQSMADILEGLISRCPSQWLLLPTLSFEMPQMSGCVSE